MPDLLIFGRRYVDGPRLRLWGEVKLRERAFAGSYWVPRDQMWHFADLQTESGIMVIYLIVDAAERRIYSAPLSTLWELGFGPSCQADRVLIEQARLYRGCKIPPEIPI